MPKSPIASTWMTTAEMIQYVSSIMEDVGILSSSRAIAQLKSKEYRQSVIATPDDPYDEKRFLEDAKIIDPTIENLDKKCLAILKWAKKQSSTTHPLILSAVFDFMIRAYGPCKIGNEEVSLSYAIAILSSFRKVFDYFPIYQTIKGDAKGAKKAIEESNAKGDIAPYIVFVLRKVEEAIASAKAALKEDEGVPTTCVAKLLKVMRAGQAYSSKSLMERLGLKSRVAVKRNYLEPAMKMGLIQMTLPEKINSPLQRYMKTKRKDEASK